MTDNSERTALILEAQRKGFGVLQNDDNSGWLVSVPSRPRLPAHTQGEFKSSDRAWSAACLIATEYPLP